MGRPKKSSGDVLAYDIRLTPITGEPIDFQSVSSEDFVKFICCQEGGVDSGKRLHYHVYAETIRSETWLRSMCRKMTGGEGNASYSIRKAHEGTIGYVVKEGRVQVRLGCDDKFLTEMLSKSQQYRTDLETQRKRMQRSKENSLAEVLKVVAEGVSSSSQPSQVMASILQVCYQKQIRFPARATLENAVMTLLYPHNQDLVHAYYFKNLPFQSQLDFFSQNRS